MAQVLIDGFKNLEEAREFCNWYSNQGEQDISIWMECREDEGLNVRTSIYCKDIETIVEKNMVVMNVR